MSKETKLFYQALIDVYNAHKQYSVQRFNKLDITTGQPKILSILLNKEGYLQKDLAHRCHVEPATMTSLLKKMELKGLIKKQQETVSGGKKAYAIYLTEKGRSKAWEVKQITDKAEAICFQGFTEEDKKMIIDCLSRIQTNLENQMN